MLTDKLNHVVDVITQSAVAFVDDAAMSAVPGGRPSRISHHPHKQLLLCAMQQLLICA